MLMQEGKRDEAEEAKKETGNLKAKSKDLTVELRMHEENLRNVLYKIPNLPHKSIKPGKSDMDNEILWETGEKPTLHDKAKPHWELIQDYDIIDFELGVKITGAGFPVYKGKGAKLQRALINFFLDEAETAGYN